MLRITSRFVLGEKNCGVRCTLHRVGLISPWDGKTPGNITYVTGGINMTFMSHSITQISMSVLHKKNYVMPLLTLRAVTQMDRTIASATMDS